MRCTDCNTEINPVVAIDIDGTLGDYHRHFIRFAEMYFGMHLPDDWDGVGDWEEHLGLTKAEYREAKLAYRQGGQKRNMPLFTNAAFFMDRVAKGWKVEIWLTTTRPWRRLDNVDPDTQEWLRRNQIPYDHLLYDENKYRKLGELVGEDRVIAVVDDLKVECERADSVFGDGKALQHKSRFNYGSRHTTRVTLEEAGDIILERITEWWKADQSWRKYQGHVSPKPSGWDEDGN